MDIDATGFDETGHVDESLFGGDGNPKIDSFAVSLAVAIGDKRTGRHEASSVNSLFGSIFLTWD